jgi:hypothetical protein
VADSNTDRTGSTHQHQGNNEASASLDESELKRKRLDGGLRKDGKSAAVELHSDCLSTAAAIQNSVALSTVAGVRRFIRTQARRGG